MRFLIIPLILLIACQSEKLNNQEKLSGKWIFEKELKNNHSQLPDTLAVIEFEFVTDSTGLLYHYNVYTRTGQSDKEKQKEIFDYQDSFKVDNNFNELTIIPGHLLRPIRYNIHRLDDTLMIKSKNVTEEYYKFKK